MALPRNRFRLSSLLPAAMLAVTVVGCSNLYAQSMKRGDELAAAGLWDRAAAQYATAVAERPGDVLAARRLREAHTRQALQRLDVAVVLLDRGDWPRAMDLVGEASQLCATCPDVQRRVNATIDRVLQRAEDQQRHGHPQKAMEMAEAVLRLAPDNQKAYRIDQASRSWISDQWAQAAQRHAKAGYPGAALLDLAMQQALVSDRAGGEQLRSLRDELTRKMSLHVTLTKRDSATGQDLTQWVSDSMLSTWLSPVQLVDVTPRAQRQTDDLGIDLVIAGTVETLPRFERVQRRRSTCSYVCGREVHANPERDRAQRQVDEAAANVARIEQRVDDRQRDVDEQQRQVDRLQECLLRAERRQSRARERLERCRERRRPRSGRCHSERNALQSASDEVSRCRDRLEFPLRRLRQLRDDLSRQRRELQRSHDAHAQALDHLRGIPTTIETVRHCTRTFEIRRTTYGVQARVSVSSRSSDDAWANVFPGTFQVQASRSFESYEAAPNQCPASAPPHGSPPSKERLLGLLSNQIAKQIATMIRQRYEKNRAELFARARAAEQSDGTKATDLYVRYLLSSVPTSDDRNSRSIALNYLRSNYDANALQMLDLDR